jgi:cation:H+ antiporter
MLEYVLFVLGIALLVKGADFLVEGSSSFAKRVGISSLVVGLSIVSFGTSTPELFVNVFAALNGTTEVAFGNIIGSNMSNILLVLGLTAFIYPLKIHKSTVWKEIPFSILAVLVLFLVANDFIIEDSGFLTVLDGVILLLFFVFFVFYLFSSMKSKKVHYGGRKMDTKDRRVLRIWGMIILGILGLYFGGKLVVEGAVFMAESFGWSEFLVSATIVAVGTSLPELVTSVVAAFKKNSDLAVGNIIGSNIFNILWILGVTSLISPVGIPGFVNVDLVILLLASVLLFGLMFIRKKSELGRLKGSVLVLAYAAYVGFLFIRG